MWFIVNMMRAKSILNCTTFGITPKLQKNTWNGKLQ